jgi:hypothetical protein
LTIKPKKSRLTVEEKDKVGKVPMESDTNQREGENIMAKKNTTATTTDAATTSENGENVQAHDPREKIRQEPQGDRLQSEITDDLFLPRRPNAGEVAILSPHALSPQA